VQDKPRLFSTFMMWMLAQLYHNLPEAGDLPKPKLVFFFDEAHLLFDDASKAFLEQVQQVVRLIRSKGVGVYFVTQIPTDVPDDILAQLGHRVQHALRAHTPDDDKALNATVRTFPKTTLFDLRETLTTLGIGEAAVTILDSRGVPTPVFPVRLIPPASRMGPLTGERSRTARRTVGQVGCAGGRATNSVGAGRAHTDVDGRQDRNGGGGGTGHDGGPDRGARTGARNLWHAGRIAGAGNHAQPLVRPKYPWARMLGRHRNFATWSSRPLASGRSHGESRPRACQRRSALWSASPMGRVSS